MLAALYLCRDLDCDICARAVVENPAAAKWSAEAFRATTMRNSGHNPHTKFYESNGPDVKVRRTASSVAEKYQQLARDLHTSGIVVTIEPDPVCAVPLFGDLGIDPRELFASVIDGIQSIGRHLERTGHFLNTVVNQMAATT